MKIKVQKRSHVGRKVKNLFEENLIPAVVYGPKRKSLNIQIPRKEVNWIYEHAGHSKLIDMEIEGEDKATKVLIREAQFDPVTDRMKHISFFELDMTKPITTDIPLVTKGESKAVKENIGFLVTPMETLLVRCLPENLPPFFEIDISSLNEIGDSILVSDLSIPEGVELDSEVSENASIAYIAPPQKEIIEEEPEVEEEEGEEEKEEGEEEGEGEEGEAEEEGEEKSEKTSEEVEKKEE